MINICNLTYNGYCDNEGIVTVSAIELVRFLSVYPEIINIKKLTISNTIVYLKNDDINVNTIVYDGDMTNLYIAIGAWLEMLIKVQIAKSVSVRVEILFNIIPEGGTCFTISPFDIISNPLDESDKYSQFGFSFSKKIASVTDEVILDNIRVLREVRNLCV